MGGEAEMPWLDAAAQAGFGPRGEVSPAELIGVSIARTADTVFNGKTNAVQPPTGQDDCNDIIELQDVINLLMEEQ